jgi:SNF2 family DNA or RNA helicase
VKTYGKIAAFENAYIIEAEPHVLLRLKRVFPRISKKKHGKICIADTLETSRELHWFMSRYPLAYNDNATERRVEERASQHRESETIVDALINGVQKAQHFQLALPPREYQRVSAGIVLATGGLLIADDMGLGKTVQGICVLTDPRARPALVCTLTPLPSQWESEIKKFAPRLTTHILRGTMPYDLRKWCGGVTPDVVITSYSKLANWGDTLAKFIKCVIWDEVQEFRNGTNTQKGAAGFAISRAADFRVGLSGTPFYNMGGELWEVMEMIRPGALGTKAEFSEEWCVGDSEKPGKLKIKEPKALGTYLRDAGLMVRRTRAQVGREIPRLTRILQHVDTDAHILQNVEDKATELAKIILATNERSRGDKMQAAQELSVLVRQATGIAKAPFVAQFVRMIVESGENVIVFGWHREVYAILMEQLKDLAPAMYTGSESTNQKLEAKRRFMEKETKVLLMSLRAGAGLDGLQQVCRTVAFAELDYSPGVMEQDIARVHRDSQKHPVMAYFLLADSGSDPVVADILGIKRAQIEGVRDPAAEMIEQLEGDTDHVRKLAQAYIQKKLSAKARGR